MNFQMAMLATVLTDDATPDFSESGIKTHISHLNSDNAEIRAQAFRTLAFGLDNCNHDVVERIREKLLEE